MFLLALLALCLATVPLLGGRLQRLADIEFRRPQVGVAAVVLQTLILGVFPDGDARLLAGVHLFTYALMFWFLVANLALPGLWLIGLGGALNALAIGANDGVMPARPGALATAGITQAPGEFVNSGAVADPNLWFLGDVFALPAGWPLANVFSIGDIVLIIGAFVLLHRVCSSVIAPALARAGAFARPLVHLTGPQLGLLRSNAAFRRLWLALAISTVGDFVYLFAVFIAVVDDDTQAASLAFLLIAHFAPGFLVGLFGGPAIDRYSRKRLMILTDVVRGLAVATLLVVGDPSLPHLYAVACILGVGGAIFQPAMQASLPNIVARRDLVAANAFVGVTLSIAVIIGPPLGAAVVSGLGVDWGFIVNALSFGVSGLLVARAAIPVVVRSSVPTAMVRELAEGMRYVRRNRPVLAVVIVVGLITLAAGIKQPLEPLFALRALDAGAAGYGLLGFFWGLGMIAATLFATRLDARFGRQALITWSSVLVGCAVLLAAGSPVLWPVLGLWLVAGVANTIGTVAYETLIQEETPDHVRGRVFAAVEASIHLGLLGGVALAALAGPVFGAHPSREGIAVSGTVFLLAGVVSWRMLGARPARARRGAGMRSALRVRSLDVVPAGPSMSLLRLSVDGRVAEPPVLLVDDGSRVHRLEPLPAGRGDGLAYGVPSALLALRRTALALEVRGRGLVDIALPG